MTAAAPEFKVVPPYPIESKVTLASGTVIKGDIILLEYRGMIIHIKTPTLKAGDRVTVDFLLPEFEHPAIVEKSRIIKLYIQILKGKPAYYAELHFDDVTKANSNAIEKFHHENEVKRIAEAANKLREKLEAKKKVSNENYFRKV